MVTLLHKTYDFTAGACMAGLVKYQLKALPSSFVVCSSVLSVSIFTLQTLSCALVQEIPERLMPFWGLKLSDFNLAALKRSHGQTHPGQG